MQRTWEEQRRGLEEITAAEPVAEKNFFAIIAALNRLDHAEADNEYLAHRVAKLESAVREAAKVVCNDCLLHGPPEKRDGFWLHDNGDGEIVSCTASKFHHALEP